MTAAEASVSSLARRGKCGGCGCSSDEQKETRPSILLLLPPTCVGFSLAYSLLRTTYFQYSPAYLALIFKNAEFRLVDTLIVINSWAR